ncbi:arginine--tRNA ligase [Parvularcula dongshanensis]|uniref:Arginine--tRNA ligase n=1 Tax=Parvularcula dongshanensis TaxID=1173995 RepID=A0A840HZF7_9PROT|nr:arginyl-tRNA synthetase [Parvularcula dongshanensis]
MSATLTDRLSAVVGRAFEAQGLDAALGTVRPSDRPDLCQFQCNGALAAAKQAKRNPREVGAAVAKALKGEAVFATVELAGPGFLNLTLTDEALSEAAQAAPAGWTAPTPQKIVVDYGGANVAKPLHVGHLRSALIGEAIKRTLRAVGHEAVGDIHLGDWGLQMGQLIVQMAEERPDLPYFDEGFEGPYPEESPVTVDDLAALYPRASAACKAKKDELDTAVREAAASRLAKAQGATAALQAGRPGYRALWQHFIDVSLPALEADYGRLGAQFELWRGEASVNDRIAPLVARLEGQGLLEESDGAKVVRVARADDKKEMPPLLMIKSNGSVGYGSTDLATIDERAEEGFERCLYVVDKRQGEHFEQVFRAADAAGIMAEDRLEFCGFGTMNGKDGKPFKTRAGGVLRLSDLFEMVLGKARDRLSEGGVGADYPEEERQAIAEAVGMAALKFADLSNPRTTDYVFDLDRFVAFEGKTGPYLLYAAVRIDSVLQKAAYEGGADGFRIGHEAERDLALALAAYPDALRASHDRRMPHVLCDHAYAVAQAFSRFYAACRIGDEADRDVRTSRLALAKATSEQLHTVLDLLGIALPPRM